MDGLIQLAAYVLIILIIGIATLVKKYVEAQKRRQEFEKKNVKTLRLDTELSNEQTRTIIVERIPEREEEPETRPVSIEDVLRKILVAPSEMPKAQPIEEAIIQQMPSDILAKPLASMRFADDNELSIKINETAEQPGGWHNFTAGLKEKELTEIQQAIIMAELVQSPVMRKRRILLPFNR